MIRPHNSRAKEASEQRGEARMTTEEGEEEHISRREAKCKEDGVAERVVDAETEKKTKTVDGVVEKKDTREVEKVEKQADKQATAKDGTVSQTQEGEKEKEEAAAGEKAETVRVLSPLESGT